MLLLWRRVFSYCLLYLSVSLWFELRLRQKPHYNRWSPREVEGIGDETALILIVCPAAAHVSTWFTRRKYHRWPRGACPGFRFSLF